MFSSVDKELLVTDYLEEKDLSQMSKVRLFLDCFYLLVDL